MNPKIQKLRAEQEKNEEKIRKLEARNAELKEQIRELENTDIVGIVRDTGITPEELAALLLTLKQEKKEAAANEG